MVEKADISSLVFSFSHSVVISSPLFLQICLPASHILLAITPSSLVFSYFSLCLSLVFPKAHPETRTWMQVVSCRGDPKKQAIEKGVHETQKRGKPLRSGLTSGLLLWATGGQCYWGLFKRWCQIYHNYPPRGREAGVFLHQLQFQPALPPWSDAGCHWCRLGGFCRQ